MENITRIPYLATRGIPQLRHPSASVGGTCRGNRGSEGIMRTGKGRAIAPRGRMGQTDNAIASVFGCRRPCVEGHRIFISAKNGRGCLIKLGTKYRFNASAKPFQPKKRLNARAKFDEAPAPIL